MPHRGCEKYPDAAFLVARASPRLERLGMHRIFVALAVAFFLPFSIDSGFAAPTQIYGKSIVVSWTEQRDQREPWQQHHRFVMRTGQFSIYVSNTGRVFTRFNYAGGRSSAPSDQVGSGDATIPRVVSFHGRSLSITMRLDGGAR